MTSYAVIGLGFGDEGKGATVDWLCRETGIETVVRFSGGCQAGHNVVTPEGLHHTFSQFGSGTFAGARTIHTGGMMIEPYSFMAEADALKTKGVNDPLSLVDFDRECLITTPYHWIINQLREDARAPDEKHGSCGRGIGETRRMQITYNAYVTVDDLDGPNLLEKLKVIHALYLSEFPDVELPDPAEVYENYRDFASKINITRFHKEHVEKGVILEGSQGILLDETWGFHPHTTWSDLTLGMWSKWANVIHVLGCTRSYATRHGAGPFPSEGSLPRSDPHNPSGLYQGEFRVGHLDLALLEYSINVVKATMPDYSGMDSSWWKSNMFSLVVNHMDEAPKEIHRSPLELFNGKPSLDDSEKAGLLLSQATSEKVADFSLENLYNNWKSDVPIYAIGRGPTWQDRVKVG